KYIIIDCRESSIEYLSQKILESELLPILNYKNFSRVGTLSQKSFVVEACDKWNSGKYNIISLAEELKVSRDTVRSYLRRGSEVGLCIYSPSQEKEVVQLDLQLNLIKKWDSGTL